MPRYQIMNQAGSILNPDEFPKDVCLEVLWCGQLLTGPGVRDGRPQMVPSHGDAQPDGPDPL